MNPTPLQQLFFPQHNIVTKWQSGSPTVRKFFSRRSIATSQNCRGDLSRMKRKGFQHPEHPSADGIADKALFSAIIIMHETEPCTQ